MSANAAPLPQAKSGNEPSMEEILASIRRIIADDTIGTKKDEAFVQPPAPQVAPVAAEPALTAPPAEDPDADVLDLASVSIVRQEVDDDLMVGSAEPLDAFDEQLEGTPVVIDSQPIVAPALITPKAPTIALPEAPLNSVPAMTEHILRSETGGLVANAFAQLQRHTALPASGRTIEDLMTDMLRPMLADWMDSHLPGIVERLVKAEIERVSRGG